MKYHKPVLLKETLQFLHVEKGKKYIDATLGDGGHTLEILKLGGKVLAFDMNEGSILRAESRIKDLGLEEQAIFVKENFKNLEKTAIEKDFGQVEGILLDLGVSTSQIDDDELSLSFKSGYELDMRLDRESKVKAFDLVNGLYEKELEELFR